MSALEQGPTAYEILGVHPSAPTDLISACYWAMTSDLQKKRKATEPEADAALHRLTHAYELVSDPVRRGGYNLSIGYTDEPLIKRALPRRRFFLLRVFRRNRHALGWSVDPCEVLGLHANAPEVSVSVAYRIMRDTYLRLPPGSRRREKLLNLLDESYAILRGLQEGAQLAGSGPAAERELPAPVRDDPPGSDFREPSQTEVVEAKVALPIAVPAPVEAPRPPKTPLRSSGGSVAARAEREDAGGARRAAVAIVAYAVALAGTVARGFRWVVVAVAAALVVVAGGVATGVHWAALAVAALTLVAARFVARSVRSGWLAVRKWLRQSGEERRETRASRSREASSGLETADEIFLGRLASTVGKSKTDRRRPSD